MPEVKVCVAVFPLKALREGSVPGLSPSFWCGENQMKISVALCSVAQLCPTLCCPMDLIKCHLVGLPWRSSG